MLFHVSIEADDPRRVAHALAEIIGGYAAPFPAVIEGSWVALAGDDRGTMIEVYPRGTELRETEAGAKGFMGPRRRYNPTHIALASELPVEKIYAIAEREGWVAKYFRRIDKFGLIEMWIEGCVMIEVLTPEMQREYLETITIENWKKMLAAAPEVAEAA